MRKNKKYKARNKTKNWEKKEKTVQRGTPPEMGPKIDFLHKNCQEKSQRN